MASPEDLAEIKERLTSSDMPPEQLAEVLAMLPGWTVEPDNDPEGEGPATLLFREIPTDAATLLTEGNEYGELLDHVAELPGEQLNLGVVMDAPNDRVKKLKFGLEGELRAATVLNAVAIEAYLRASKLV
jgi:hypothetical protein